MVSALKRALGGEGHVIDVALGGEHALWHASEFDYDAILLDLGLPGRGGIPVGQQLRDRQPWIPILMLVTHDDLAAHERDLWAITDNFVLKPIALPELTAQLGALTYLRADLRPRDIQVGDLRMRPATRQAWRGATELNLAPREFALLQLFLTQPGKVLNRAQILESIWARNHGGAPNLVDQYVLYLRRKIDRPFGVRQLETIRGIGYRLREFPTPSLSTVYPWPGVALADADPAPIEG